MGKLFALKRRSKKEHMPTTITATENGSIVPTVVDEDASSHSKGRSLRVAVNVKTALAKWRKRATKAPTTEALCIVAGFLNEAANMTQGVPYIQTLSSLITYVVSVNDDIDLLRFERGLLRDKVLQLQSMVDETERRLGPDIDIPMDLQEPFMMLERILKQVVVVLRKCFAANRTLGKAKLLVSRKDLMKKIERCDAEVNAALACFNTKLQVIQSLDIKGVQTEIGTVFAKLDSRMVTLEAAVTVVEMHSQKNGKAGSVAITYVVAVPGFFF